jgi:hypothetical protein
MDKQTAGIFDRPAGSWILQEDGTLVPDMNDEATVNRHGLKAPEKIEEASAPEEVKKNARK